MDLCCAIFSLPKKPNRGQLQQLIASRPNLRKIVGFRPEDLFSSKIVEFGGPLTEDLLFFFLRSLQDSQKFVDRQDDGDLASTKRDKKKDVGIILFLFSKW